MGDSAANAAQRILAASSSSAALSSAAGASVVGDAAVSLNDLYASVMEADSVDAARFALLAPGVLAGAHYETLFSVESCNRQLKDMRSFANAVGLNADDKTKLDQVLAMIRQFIKTEAANLKAARRATRQQAALHDDGEDDDATEESDDDEREQDGDRAALSPASSGRDSASASSIRRSSRTRAPSSKVKEAEADAKQGDSDAAAHRRHADKSSVARNLAALMATRAGESKSGKQDRRRSKSPAPSTRARSVRVQEPSDSSSSEASESESTSSATSSDSEDERRRRRHKHGKYEARRRRAKKHKKESKRRGKKHDKKQRARSYSPSSSSSSSSSDADWTSSSDSDDEWSGDERRRLTAGEAAPDPIARTVYARLPGPKHNKSFEAWVDDMSWKAERNKNEAVALSSALDSLLRRSRCSLDDLGIEILVRRLTALWEADQSNSWYAASLLLIQPHSKSLLPHNLAARLVRHAETKAKLTDGFKTRPSASGAKKVQGDAASSESRTSRPAKKQHQSGSSVGAETFGSNARSRSSSRGPSGRGSRSAGPSSGKDGSQRA